MEKTIKLGDKEVRISNNAGWAIAYREQFGHDIISTLTPLLASALDVISNMIKPDKDGKIDLGEVLRELDGNVFIDAMAHFSGFEFVEVIYIIWAMAKAADDDILEPKTWIRQFDVFPLDALIPDVAKMAVMGLVTSKNFQRLNELKKKFTGIQPLTLTQ